MTESSLAFWFIYMISCILFFVAGILIAIFNKSERKSGIRMIIFAIIGFIIGFGGCAVYLNYYPIRI